MSLEIAQLPAGMDAVEAAVRDGKAGHGADNLVAMRWRGDDTITAVSIPEALHLDAIFVVRQISSVFSREQLEDSASGLRANVRLMVDELVRSLLANRHSTGHADEWGASLVRRMGQSTDRRAALDVRPGRLLTA